MTPTRIDQPPVMTKAGQTRRTEDTDTRQAIQRHDPEFYRKKKDDGEQPGFKDPYEDLADVSVPALKNFLTGLLDKMPDPASAQPGAASSEAAPRAPSNPKAAAAVNAYQAGAVRGMAAPPPPPPPAAPPAQGGSALDQAAANLDRATVLELIRDLDRLYAEGIAAVSLEKGDGFLESIRDAIDRARS